MLENNEENLLEIGKGLFELRKLNEVISSEVDKQVEGIK